jgi:hypothetical protein
MKRLITLFSITLLCAGVSFAQRGGRGGGGRSAARSMNEDQVVQTFTLLLQLKDAERNALQSIIDAALPDAMALRKEIEAGKDALYDAAKAGKTDEEIDKVANAQAELAFRMKALETRTFAKFWRGLTSDQQAKADSFFYDQIALFLESGDQPASRAQKP